MSARTRNVAGLLSKVDQALEVADKKHTFENGLGIAKEIIGLLGIENVQADLKSFPRLKANPSWTKNAPDYEDRKASFALAENNNCNIDIKFFWVTKPAKRIISNLVALTPNFEDEAFYSNKSVGIDFVLPDKPDRLIVVLSNNYKIRILEVHRHLSNTQKKIFEKWAQEFDFSNKAQVHKILWDSFDIQPLNKEFYLGISSFFNDLVQHLEKENILDKKHRSQFVNRLIGRIIFCWFLRKKEIIAEDVGYFDAEGKMADEYYAEKLEMLFFKVLNTPIEERGSGIDDKTPFLNGGLFEPKESDLWGLHKLSFPADYFERFYSFLNRYNFTTDESTSDFQQVAIDPEMLGRIFENLLAEEMEETGEQARKAKGAFYTPREIVDYMCRESLRAYVSEKLGEDARKGELLQLLFDKKEHELDLKGGWGNLGIYKNRIIGILDEIKIIDPACGSGAFPIGMLQIMLSIYERLDTRLDHFRTKFGIIKNNIYGVDIEPMAVEIARLRTWLSLIVDEDIDDKAKNRGIEPLPNLDFKFVCANSLVSLKGDASSKELFDTLDENKLLEIREKYFNARSYARKQELRQKYERLLSEKGEQIFSSNRQKQIETYRPFDSDSVASFFDPDFMYSVKSFHIVVSNPPYVCNKAIDEDLLSLYEQQYGLRDDLYNYFFIRSVELLAENGVLSFISSDTYFTIMSKYNLRELFLDKRIVELIRVSNVFEVPMVEPAIIILKNSNHGSAYAIPFKDALTDFISPQLYTVNSEIYRDAIHKVFFPPTKFNLQIYAKYNSKVKQLLDEWWERISTSRNIEKNKSVLKMYRKNLNSGDVTILGLVTEGGQGLATANNGRFVAVLAGTKAASNIIESRPTKLLEAILKNKIRDIKVSTLAEARKFLGELKEDRISVLFEQLKDKYGRDIFGRGYIHKIVDQNAIADVAKLTKEEKENGIALKKPHFVLYDKGDKGGNRWYLETPFFIDWSEEAVHFLTENSGKKGEGMPVVRNPQFYFKDGFCWSDINTIHLKCRIKNAGIYDVKSMSLFSMIEKTPDWFLVCIINSTFISEYVNDFVNNTQTFQINDARQLPIVIPSDQQLNKFKHIFDSAFKLKIAQFASKITSKEAEKQLKDIQVILDQEVLCLYGLAKE